MDLTVECPVCMESFAPRKLVTCNACDTQSCVACTKTYLLGQVNDAQCMNTSCRAGWDYKFVKASALPITWYRGVQPGQYMHSRKQVLLDRERALIPEAMAVLEHRKQVELVRHAHTLQEQATGNIDHEIAGLQRALTNIEHRKTTSKLLGTSYLGIEEEIILRTIDELNAQRDESMSIVPFLRQLGLDPLTAPMDEDNAVLAKGYRFICACPIPECRGLVPKGTHVCSVCNSRICHLCYMPRPRRTSKTDPRHTCISEHLETARLLRQDTKPCPKCAAPIQKNGGCDHMWCSQCHTHFSWKSGNITASRGHNPHEVRWNVDHGRLPGGVALPCEGFTHFDTSHALVNKYKKIMSGKYTEIATQLNADPRPGALNYQTDPWAFHCNSLLGVFWELDATIERLNDHVEEPRRRGRGPVRSARKTLLEYRIDYIEKRITEDQWKQKIYVMGRRNAKRRTKRDVLTTMRTIAVERFHVYTTGTGSDRHASFITDIMNIIQFINETFVSEFGDGQHGKVPQITMTAQRWAYDL